MGSSHLGSPAGARTFRCADCRFPITLLEADEAPRCPRCDSTSFEPASIFSGETVGLPAPALEPAPDWLPDVRAAIGATGPHLAWDTAEEIETAALPDGFTHIGRSLQADIRLLDPTVSRRHALVHRTGGYSVLLDDHSLNGVFIGGERVDWQPLIDGDEIELGRYRLHFIAGQRRTGRFRPVL